MRIMYPPSGRPAVELSPSVARLRVCAHKEKDDPAGGRSPERCGSFGLPAASLARNSMDLAR
jgi:hypothetical protein